MPKSKTVVAVRIPANRVACMLLIVLSSRRKLGCDITVRFPRTVMRWNGEGVSLGVVDLFVRSEYPVVNVDVLNTMFLGRFLSEKSNQ